jgi:murein DD-endopeptidase MepM/ murein hydrolase activator NlpD
MTVLGGRDGRRRHRRLPAALLGIALGLMLGACGGPATAAAGGLVHAGDSGSGDSSSGDSAPGYPWSWPTDGQRLVIAPFRAPAHEYGPGHRGMDVAVEPGSPVRSPADGVIAFRGTVVDRPLITIDHGHGYVTTLEPVAPDLSPGDAVVAGDALGTLAHGGHAPRGTLHVGVRVDDVYVNPRGLFGSPPRAILLPCCES